MWNSWFWSKGSLNAPNSKFCPQGPRLAAPHLTLTHGIFWEGSLLQLVSAVDSLFHSQQLSRLSTACFSSYSCWQLAVAVKQSTACNRCQSCRQSFSFFSNQSSRHFSKSDQSPGPFCIWHVFNWLFKTGIIVLSLKTLEHVESMNKTCDLKSIDDHPLPIFTPHLYSLSAAIWRGV